MGSSSGNKKRQHMVARRAYLLKQEGKTNREIAELIQRPVEKIPAWILLGERLSPADNSKPRDA